jgi:2-keto-4-pentenoate hydratase
MSMTMSYDEVARRLMQEHTAGQNFHPLGPDANVRNVDDAYGVQRSLVELMRPKAGTPVGYKIGLTSARMQKMCGIDRPVAGMVLANRVHATGAVLQAARYGRLGLEFEIGVRVGRDLPPAEGPFEMDGVAQAVDGVCAAVELVDDRHADYATLDAVSLIADNSWSAGVVLGEFKTTWPDLAAVRGTVQLNGGEVDRGHGRDVLGHPFVPLTWLANHLAATGDGLKAGDFVLTGSLVTTRFPKEPKAYRYELAGIGAVELTVTI